jgi:hypothetical protein
VWRAKQAVIELLDGEGAVWMQKKLGRARKIDALATVEGNKVGWTLIFYAAAGGQPDVVAFCLCFPALFATSFMFPSRACRSPM